MPDNDDLLTLTESLLREALVEAFRAGVVEEADVIGGNQWDTRPYEIADSVVTRLRAQSRNAPAGRAGRERV